MVRTLKNAFDADRIAHAFILTGVCGVVRPPGADHRRG